MTWLSQSSSFSSETFSEAWLALVEGLAPLAAGSAAEGSPARAERGSGAECRFVGGGREGVKMAESSC